MKKPQCKDTCVETVCQAFYRQYMLSPEELCTKKCYKKGKTLHNGIKFC